MTNTKLVITSDYHGESRKTTDIKNSLAKAAQAGFSHIFWCHEFGSSYIYSVYEMLQINNWCNELGLLIKGVHASIGDRGTDLKNFASGNDYNRLAGTELIKNRVDLAYVPSTDAIVLHLGFPWERALESNKTLNDLLRPVFRSFDELEAYCKTRGIKICLENTGGTIAECSAVFDAIFKRYSGDYMGLCFDTGHAYMQCRENCLEYAQRYNDRLFMIHCADNHGESDEHLIPFEGGFDWEAFAPVLAQSPYELPILLESMNNAKEDDTLWLKRAYDAGSRFSAMVEKYR
ncbi:MAG: sugar phosphate isomerase/epimerase [Treponema sp.]|nr:sugar phosphate isomerase/epimerase [Treponema sp.]